MPLPAPSLPIRDRILAILKKHGPLSFNPIAIETNMGKKKSNLSYHLSELIESGRITKVKIPGSVPTYSLASPSTNPTETKVIECLSHDDFKTKSTKEIMEAVQGVEKSEVAKALKRMASVQKIEVYSNQPVLEEGQSGGSRRQIAESFL